MTNRRPTTLSARLTRVAAPLLLTGLALSACSSDEPDPAPTPSASSSASDSTPSASATASSTPTVTVPASPTATSTPTATPTITPKPTPTTVPPKPAACAAAKVGAPNTTGMSAAAAATSKKISAAAKGCDASALIALAKADSTGMAGEKSPTAIFTDNSPQNYVALATLLSMQSAETFDGTVQPRVFSERYSKDDAEWDKVIAAGLVTRSAAATMRQQDGGYTGYRVGIASDGTWSFFTVGR